jgi:hypothetical protein
LFWSGIAAALLGVIALPAAAQSFRVQCPNATALHPDPATLAPASAAKIAQYKALVGGSTNANVQAAAYAAVFPGHIKCQQLSGGDGFATMADGTQMYLFAFGPLSGLGNIVHGLPGTVTNTEFNQSNLDGNGNVLPVVKVGAPDSPDYSFNGAIGLVPDTSDNKVGSVTLMLDPNTDLPVTGGGYTVGEGVVFTGGGGTGATGHIAALGAGRSIGVRADGITAAITIDNPGSGYISPPTVSFAGGGTGAEPIANLVATNGLTGHVDERLIMDVGVMNGSFSAPTIAIDEDDELFLTLTNVGMVMRPDLFEQHTVHFHGYPNASAFYDGVPDASVAINIGGSFTYYYLAPEAGTYMWHCHISPPEHLQMGMVGQIYVRPRQNAGTSATLYAEAQADQLDLSRKCSATDILCSVQLPPANTVARVAGKKYAFDDGDGSTAYDVEYPIQMHGFDPNFHFVGMTFNPESFADTKDKYFLLNGRSYPDTINPAPMHTQSTDGTQHYSQPLSTVINIPLGGKALLRFSDLNVTEYHTLASLGIRMHVVGFNARLLRDQDGTNTDYYTNSITLAGGESIDVILDASDTTLYPANSKFYLYTPQLDHLSNDAENFGGMMTEVNICPSASFDANAKKCL